MKNVRLIDANEAISNILSHEIRIKKWDPIKVDDFKNNIDRNKVDSVCIKLSNIINENVTSYYMNEIMTEISDILLESARDTFGTFEITGSKPNCNFSKKHGKHWFNSECHNARKEYRKSKRLCKHYGSN